MTTATNENEFVNAFTTGVEDTEESAKEATALREKREEGERAATGEFMTEFARSEGTPATEAKDKK